jgi:hypothetical protein
MALSEVSASWNVSNNLADLHRRSGRIRGLLQVLCSDLTVVDVSDIAIRELLPMH